MNKKPPPQTISVNEKPELNTQNGELEAQIKILESNWKRALADYQNLLRRVEHDKQQITKLSNANLIARLLPCLDIIEMAAIHSKDIGVEMAAKQFSVALAEEGLQLISPAVGDLFDLSHHECTETIEALPDNDPDTISELVLKGYKLGDFVLRPAKVKVFKKSQIS